MTGNSFYSVEKDVYGRSGGTTQAESRIYNERLVISLIRRHGRLSKVELTNLTGLSAQTITTIVNRAADSQLLQRLEPLRGRLGQPSVPYALAPAGAFSFGLKVDHRSADLVLINFVGDVMAFERTTFDYPIPTEVMAFAKAAIGRIRRKQKTVRAERIAGLGIASPFHLWNWSSELAVPPGALDAWKQVDIRAELDRVFDWPVYLFNDGTVSAGAELMFGSGAGRTDFLYAYIGYFIGGGLVLDHHLFPGRSNQAGAVGNMPVPGPGSSNSGMVPLMRIASIHSLAGKLNSGDTEKLWSSPEDWRDLGAPLAEWIDEVSEGLAYVVRGAVALLDVDNVVIDGAIPADVRKEIAKATRRKLTPLIDRPEPFSLVEGTYGHIAPAIGGASIPFLVNYSNDKDLLFKE